MAGGAQRDAVFDRSILGAADISDAALTAMVEEDLGVNGADLVSCRAEVAEYDLDALTTAGRYWVRGTVRHSGGLSAFSFFVKVVQSWTRSPQFQRVPEPLREIATAALPWRSEPAVYESDLRSRLPDGLSMPRAYAVRDIDDLSAGLWLQSIDHDTRHWGADTFARAAYLLGRLAASPVVRPLRDLGSTDVVRRYGHGRLEHQVLPMLRSEELWAHPLVSAAFDPDLTGRLLDTADRTPDLLRELDRAPLATAHGDACSRNILLPQDDRQDLVLIDFGFWCEAPVAFDLTQLLLGEVQTGERPASDLAGLEEICLLAYHRGLADEGLDVSLEVLRRIHALLMVLYYGLTAVPLEVLFGAPPPQQDTVRERARAAAFVLDLVDVTTGL